MSIETITRYLELLAGDERRDHFLELRWRVGWSQQLRARFFPLDQLDDLAQLIAAPPRRASDLYVGCAPRRPGPDGRPAGGGRAAVERAWTLWVECDSPDAAARLRALPIRPSALIRSGSGDNVHAYFALTEPVDVDELETANLRLAAAVDGDPVCYDAARILRAPCTRNWKHTPPTPVVAEWIEPDHRRPLHEWLAAVPALPAPAPTKPARSSQRPPAAVAGGLLTGHRPSGPDPLRAIPPAVYVAELLGVEIPRDRKISCPLHEDRHPSLHVYDAPERGWFCFSCRRGGSIYDFAAALTGLSTRGRDFPRLRAHLQRQLAHHL